MAIKILTVVGARPQFVKAGMVSHAMAAQQDMEEAIVHTGQHFDANMSEVFFDQMAIPKPHHHLNIAGLSHGAMTGRMLEAIEVCIQEEKPDWVLVYGDTNSTLAGALAAAKLHVPIAHVEAGLRAHNPNMPEEINRVLTDRISTLLLCPTDVAVSNLREEGFPFAATGGQMQRIERVGDVMYDAVLHYRAIAAEKVSLDDYGLTHQGYALCTLHRQENTDDAARLTSIFSALNDVSKNCTIVLPLHPRTRAKIAEHHIQLSDQIITLDPLPYLEMQRLMMSAKIMLTDSGGMQKEAYFHRVPCITLRDETEWVETVDAGWNVLVGANHTNINKAFHETMAASSSVEYAEGLYGDGSTAQHIIKALTN